MAVNARIEPPMEFDTPKGRALAFWMIDYTQTQDVIYGCIIKATGQIWWFRNKDVLHVPDLTNGIRLADLEIPCGP
jgi:hypothetical protein